MGDFFTKLQERRIASKYSLVRKLGEGGFGAVYLGRDFETGQEVALKLEHRLQEPSMLAEEAERYAALKDLSGFPRMYWYGWQDDYKIMVFELLGPSLEDLFVFCGRKFSLKTVLMIMDQLISRLEALHLSGLLHRDMKPQNCLLGTGPRGNIVYITDFGLSRVYDMSPDESERDYSGHPGLVGTARYASIRAHQGRSQTPADDLEALGYIMIYFLRGHLPWQGLKAHDRAKKERLIMEKKRALAIEELCAGLPREFAEYLRCIRSVPQGQRPQYAEMRALFRALAQKEVIRFDNVFDWTVRLYLQGDIQ